MGLDIRLPIGLMFTLVGLLLVIAGFVYTDAETLKRSLDINVNLWWGVLLMVFGGLMLFFALRAAKAAKLETPPKK
jgi:protein-S-isoprenylcysteine O-methyltransferase Ste14